MAGEQAQKFVGTAHEEEIRRAKNPGIAARWGRSRDRPLRSDWERVKDGVMEEALKAKFSQVSKRGNVAPSLYLRLTYLPMHVSTKT